MKKCVTSFVKRQQAITKYLRYTLALAIVLTIAAAALIIRTDTKADGGVPADDRTARQRTTSPTPSPSATPAPRTPIQTQATRLRVIVGETQDLQVATGVDSHLLVSPEFASVEAKNRFTLSVTGVKIGETMLVVTFGKRRHTYVVDVVPRPSGSARNGNHTDGGLPRQPSAVSGSSRTQFSAASGGGASSVLRQNIDYRQKLSKGRTLRVSGELFKLFGNDDRSLAIARVRDFAMNRISVGVDTVGQRLDLLDSQVDISPMSFNSFSMRGFHLTKTPVHDPDDNLRRNGLEVYAGLARPSLAFFDTNGGKIAGVMVPFFTTGNFQARTGVIAISADANAREARGGVVLQADATYAPIKEILAEVEVSAAKGDVSWRGRLDLKYLKYGATAEMTRFARSSPLNSIGAQSGGRKSELLSFYWRPTRRLTTAVGYNHTEVTRLTNSFMADYGRSLLFANAGYSITKNSRLNVRYTDQSVESSFQRSLSKIDIQTRTLSFGSSHRFNRSWSNSVEARFNFNREANAKEGLENGFSLKERLRYGWRGGSVTGFVHYNRKSPTLTSLIIRNPGLLPLELQAAFALDPAEFLRLNRDRIAFLLGGIELPQTRGTEAGVNFQKTFSRYTVSADTRYTVGEVYSVSQKYLYTSASLGVKLDRANSVHINGWKSFGGSRVSGVSVSYTHQFGTSGGGFQLTRLLSVFNKGKVRGRVFYDLNGNGVADAGEPGVAGMKVRIGGKRTVTTASDGNYELSSGAGRHIVSLTSADLGVSLLASTPTEQTVIFGSGRVPNLNFGVRDVGSVSGLVFNDLGNAPKPEVNTGLAGVKVTLRSIDVGFGSFVLETVTDGGGSYHFANLRPGEYVIEISTATLPANFRIPTITSTPVTVAALRASYCDVPLTAQRAIAGIVFVDKDGDGRYTYGKDEPVGGAAVTVNGHPMVTDATGAYLARNLPFGRIDLSVVSREGGAASLFFTELGSQPEIRRGFDLRIDHR